MYKVFINEKPIILTSDKNFSTNLLKKKFLLQEISNHINLLFANKLNGICLFSENIKEDWTNFKNYFIVQKAAGGKVLNTANEVLFIYRYDKWDLPKGKLEDRETLEICAIREVEEECGVTNLVIQKKLPTTYHVFKRESKLILKITYWFLMKTNYKEKLTPQLEEGITKVKFLNAIEQKEALQNTYKNISILFK